MATYNGESYLAEQIESILRQTETRWKLIIQDDCSTDRTAAVAQECGAVSGKNPPDPAGQPIRIGKEQLFQYALAGRYPLLHDLRSG